MKPKMSKIKVLLFNFGLLAFAYMFMFYNANPPDGKTGAPGDGTCGECHGGGSFGGNIEIIGLPSTINANEAYNITVRITNTSGNAVKAGFQLIALNGSNNNAGDLTALSSDHGTSFIGSKEYVDHRNGKNFNASNVAEWTFKWTAPAGPNGTNITLYGIGLMANNAGGSSGDNYILGNVSGQLMTNTTPVDLSITSTNITCNGANNGEATGIPSGGTPPYTYLWSTGKTTQTITGLSVGTYKLTVTDKDGQTASAQAAITQPAALSVALNSGNLTCIKTDLNIKATVSGGTAGYTYLWSTSETTQQITVDAPGTYSVTVTDANECNKSSSVAITQDIQEPTVSIDPPGLISCAQPVIEINATVFPANSQLLWSTNGGNIVSGKNSLKPLVNKPGIYTLTATNPANGCVTQEIVSVSGVVPITSTQNITNILCHGDSSGILTVTPSGGLPPYEFNWSNGQKTPTIDSLKAGTYTVYIKDKSTCFDTLVLEVKQPSKLVALVNSTDLTGPNSNDGTATVTPEGGTKGYKILWSTGDTVAMIKNLSIGSYDVVITDSLGCTANQSVFINPFNCGLVSDIQKSDAKCFGGNDGSACVEPSGGTSPYQFLWSNQTTTQCIQNLVAGTYTVTITDAVGCIFIKQVQVDEAQSIEVPNSGISITGETAFESGDASVTISVQGGTPPYLFAFDNGTSDGKNLSSGDHSVTITDSNGCTKLVGFNIAGFPCDSLGVKGINLNVVKTCIDKPISVIIQAIQGGLPPYSYKWDNGSTGISVSDFYNNINSVTVTDSKNCAAKFFTNITPPDTIKLSFDVVDVTPGNIDGSILVSTTGGLAPYTYKWTEGLTGQFIENLVSGTYCVTVTDFNGCTSVGCTEVKNKVSTINLSSQGWRVFPNPADDYIYLQKAIPDQSPVSWKIFDSAGNQISTGEEKSASGMIPVFLGELASGNYIIILKHREKEMYSKFFVK